MQQVTAHLTPSISSANSETGQSRNKKIKQKWTTKSKFLRNTREPFEPTDIFLIKYADRP